MLSMTPVQKRGFGSFPEFIGQKLRSIEHVHISGDDFPERYIFHFGNILHLHNMQSGKILDVGNYRFVGMTVSSARQYWDAKTQKSIFEFVFEGDHCLTFGYSNEY